MCKPALIFEVLLPGLLCQIGLENQLGVVRSSAEDAFDIVARVTAETKTQPDQLSQQRKMTQCTKLKVKYPF